MMVATSEKQQPLKFDTLENIEQHMPQFSQFLRSTPATTIAPLVIAQLTEALSTLAKEIRQLKDQH
jgi:hypothetical protein